MKTRTTIDGHELKKLFSAGTYWLEKIVPDINALNVYPVPDGDCGTNMLFTMRSSLDELSKLENEDASTVARAIARGALMGARGNSGVILSQIWYGLSEELKDSHLIDAQNLARALQSAAKAAYLALSNPVEGTILTVIRDVASAADKEKTFGNASLISMLTAAVAAARKSVMNTPNLLATLKEAGVVDAGGHGLFTFLEGALLHINGKMKGRSPELLCDQRPLIKESFELSPRNDLYGFCTQFMIRGQNLSVDRVRQDLEGKGESLIVVGDSATVRVHVHTHNSEEVTKIASRHGTIFDKDIRNMDDQHQDFLLMKRGKNISQDTAVVAVANGDGLIKIFGELGAAAIVPGGQTMNPSTMDILSTIERLEAQNIIILPNNKNVIPTAQLVHSLTKKQLKVIPTETIPQGISALMEFIPEADFNTNSGQMERNASAVKTIEITRATRSAKLNNLDIKHGQYIGILDGELQAVSETAEESFFQILNKISLSQARIITLYFGKDTEQVEAERIAARIGLNHPDLQIGVVNAGQPYYHYIVSVE